MSEGRKALSRAPQGEPPFRSAGAPVRAGRPAPRRSGARSGAGIRRTLRAVHAAERAAAADGATRFAERAVRMALEVLDRRRSVGQLAGLADPTVLAAVRTLVSADLVPGRALGSAVHLRVRLRLLDTDTAEVWAGYDRGGRRFALAARVARTRATGWRLTALRVR